MNVSIRPTAHADRQSRGFSTLATTTTSFTAAANIGKVIQLEDKFGRVDKLSMQQFQKAGVMTAFALVSTIGNTYAAVNDFKHGNHIKGFLRTIAAAGPAATVAYAASGGRIMSKAVVPGMIMAAAAGITAKIMDACE
jgi:hypothetical protein